MKNYKIVIGSPIDYEELVAYVVIDDTYICLVQKEEGNNKMIIEFFDESKIKGVYFNDFLQALNEAKELLHK